MNKHSISWSGPFFVYVQHSVPVEIILVNLFWCGLVLTIYHKYTRNISTTYVIVSFFLNKLWNTRISPLNPRQQILLLPQQLLLPLRLLLLLLLLRPWTYFNPGLVLTWQRHCTWCYCCWHHMYPRHINLKMLFSTYGHAVLSNTRRCSLTF